jgi:hypothetical protein
LLKVALLHLAVPLQAWWHATHVAKYAEPSAAASTCMSMYPVVYQVLFLLSVNEAGVDRPLELLLLLPTPIWAVRC